VEDLAVLDDDGPGPNPRSVFLVGGQFAAGAGSVARIVGGVPRPPGDGLDQPVHALLAGGPRLYAGGNFEYAGPVPARRVAVWQTGVGWRAFGAGLGGDVTALRLHDDGAGVTLFAGGAFTSDGGGAPLHYVARWNGTAWLDVGMGFNGAVDALAVYDDGTGVKLFAAGAFTMSGSIPVAHIARWDGVAWGPVGTGANGRVMALLAFNDGSGVRLYAGGQFTAAGGVPTANIASWNGSSWSAMGGGVGAGETAYVAALAAHSDSSGAALYAGGQFSRAGGVVCNSVARWRGGSWSALGAGVQTLIFNRTSWYYVPGAVRALVWYDDDGAGPRASALYVAGAFSLTGSAPATCLGRWDTTTWTNSLPALQGDIGSAMALLDDDGAGPGFPSLCLGGTIYSGAGVIGPLRFSNLVRLGPCPACYANCDASTLPPLLNVSDFVCFLLRYSAGDPYANCDSSTIPPVLNVADFVCFQQQFAAGCP
jgi:hypothetical protein